MYLTRIFLIATSDDGSALDPRSLGLIGGRHFAGVFGSAAACRALPPALAACASIESSLASDGLDVGGFLSAIATRHAGAELLVLGAPELVRSAVAGALNRDHDSLAIESRGLAAVDWPIDSDGEAEVRRPILVGLDLDWIPPAPSQVKTRFPGGPGSAASGR